MKIIDRPGFWFVIAILVLGYFVYTTPANATWDEVERSQECEHPRFLEHGCGYEGVDGEDGTDGVDGNDGIDGVDGQDGIDGRDGRDGVDGQDGEIPTEWITNTHNWYEQAREATAAVSAMQTHLPQDQTSRLTFGASHVNGSTGVGIGFAYILDNDRNSALTVAVGHAGSETAIRGSFGFEFGGERGISMDDFVSKSAPVYIIEDNTYEDEVPGSIDLTEPELNIENMVADLTDEQYEELRREMRIQDESNDEQYELVEYRQMQQKNLIETQAEEIERLRKEAEALRAAEEARKAAEARAQQKFRKRLATKGDLE